MTGELDDVIKESKYIACIAEGGAESAIINLLLDLDKELFNSLCKNAMLNYQIVMTER